MSVRASQITSLTIVYSIVYSDADQRKHQSSASLAFVWGIHRGPVSSPHKGPVTRKMFPFDDVIMKSAMHRDLLVLPVFYKIWTSILLCTHHQTWSWTKMCFPQKDKDISGDLSDIFLISIMSFSVLCEIWNRWNDLINKLGDILEWLLSSKPRNTYRYLPSDWHHDDVAALKRFLDHWPFVRGIHRSPMDSPKRASDAEPLCFFRTGFDTILTHCGIFTGI